MGRSKIIAEKVRVPERPYLKDWQRLLPGLAISLISLAAVFYFADLQGFLQALHLADYRLVALCIPYDLLASGARPGLACTAAGPGPLWPGFLTLNEGYLLNNLLPFRLGEVARAFLLGRKAGLDFWLVMSTILIERALDLLMAAALLLITVPFVVGASWAAQAAVAAGGIVAFGLVFLYLLARSRDQALAQFERLSVRWPLLNRLGGRVLPAFLSGLGVLNNFSQFARAAFGSSSIGALPSASITCCCRPFPRRQTALGRFQPGGRCHWDRLAFLSWLGRCHGGLSGRRPLCFRPRPFCRPGFRPHRSSDPLFHHRGHRRLCPCERRRVAHRPVPEGSGKDDGRQTIDDRKLLLGDLVSSVVRRLSSLLL